MPGPLGGRNQWNSNVYSDEIFREIDSMAFLEDLKSKTCASRVAEITTNAFAAVIHQPTINRDAIQVGRVDAYQCEIEVNSTIETSDDAVFMQDQLYTVLEICEFDEAYTEVNLTQEARREMNYKMALAVDEYILKEMATQSLNFVGPIVDSATADSIVTEVETMFIGYESVPGQKVIIAGQSMYPYFRNLFVDRITALGDEVLVTGKLMTIAGWEVCFTADSQMPDPSFAFFAVGKPLNLYIDEAGFGEDVRWKQGSTPEAINFNKIHYRTLNLVAKLWTANAPRLVVSRP